MSEIELAEEDLRSIVGAIRSIASGTAHGPDGLELVAMAFRQDNDSTISRVIEEHGTCVERGLGEVADAIQALAEALAKR